MDINKWLTALTRFLILLPAAASCYLPVRSRMKYSPAKTAALCAATLLPYSAAAALLHALLHININTILLPSLVPFFFLWRRTVDLTLSCSLAIYVGVCAIESFPAQFAYAFDAALHPASGAASISTEAALFQLLLSCLLLAAFVFPAQKYFSRAIENLDFPKIWYFTAALSCVFLIFNILAIPRSYRTLHTGRMYWLFPAFEACALAVLIVIFILFYHGSTLILKQLELEERSRLLEMQAQQYHSLQEHIRQTAKLRHDFRHSVRLLASLAEKGDIDSIRTHLSEYENLLEQSVVANFCRNAVLNALFGYYYEMAASEGISTDWRIELPEPLTFLELDLAALFGNLMENAICGCRTVPESSRYFCLTAEIRHGNRLYVVATNSFDGKSRKQRKGYSSTKHSGMGIGLASIAAVAEKYGGSAKISDNGTEFFVDVVLKL